MAKTKAAAVDDGPDLDPAWVERIRTKLLDWYRKAGRDLPWRTDPTPYRVLVSETMLVQTTVAAVIPYFERFLAKFPDFETLAAADPDEVLKAWEGLGYYRRARQLREAAKVVVGRHGGRMPSDPEAVAALPGVGRYIAGAIFSFAHGVAAPILEANTQRVAARWLAWPGELRSPATQGRLWRLAERVVSPEAPGDFNQAFMELGGTTCLPRAPLCLVCPVAGECLARREGMQNGIPVLAPKAPPKEVAETCALIVENGSVLMVRRGPGRLWERFWEFPTAHESGADPAGRRLDPPATVEAAIGAACGVKVELGPVATTIRYGVTTHKVTLEARFVRSWEGRPEPGPGYMEVAWLTFDQMSGKTMGSASRRLAEWLAARIGTTPNVASRGGFSKD